MALYWSLVVTVFLSFTVVFSETLAQPTQTFIVHVENQLKPSEFSSVEEWYRSVLERLSSTNILSSKDSTAFQTQNPDILHIYKTVFHGFSAKLTPKQAHELKKHQGILSVFPDRIRQIQTTRSPHFLGLDTAKAINGLLNESDFGSNIIIGLLDTGIWPELHSFDDDYLGPVPSRWKGECIGGEQFPETLCNKKLIGARYFSDGYRNSVPHGKESNLNSARDSIGHGTHTASTAAGRVVNNASFLGFSRGDAAGIAQKARLAMYRVCWENGCTESDILGGFDSAVADGVDVVSISIGSLQALPYEDDVIAIASFGAMEKGIFVSTSAGNNGPYSSSVSNVAPWITTVGASTIDRKFPAYLYLGNGAIITGSSLYNGDGLANTYWPLIYAGNASSSTSPSGDCFPDSIDPERVRGKIVICDSGSIGYVSKGAVVKKAGGVGMVVANVPPMGEGLIARAYLMPALAITESARTLLFAYMNSTLNPTATLVFGGGTQIGVKPAPQVAWFSARGPNRISVNVMKPDVIAPGVNIIAAYPDGIPPTESAEDHRRTEFNILSGTSMACPHVSGIAALLKGARPQWSPAMIRSALMTTAYTHDRDGNALLDETDMNVSNAWGFGAGHVNPVKALDPGLVYNLTADDYINFLCVSNLSLAQIQVITRRAVNCSEAQNLNPWDLNYPAISVAFDPSKLYDSQVIVIRTVTNVGNPRSSYRVAITNPPGAIITVYPPTLVFNRVGEKQSFKVMIAADKSFLPPTTTMRSEFGRLSWTDGHFHQVTTPVIVTWFNNQL